MLSRSESRDGETRSSAPRTAPGGMVGNTAVGGERRKASPSFLLKPQIPTHTSLPIGFARLPPAQSRACSLLRTELGSSIDTDGRVE